MNMNMNVPPSGLLGSRTRFSMDIDHWTNSRIRRSARDILVPCSVSE